jgi:SAM-dependent methyltransferase
VDKHEWDERYRSKGKLWSGEANGPLVDEIAGMTPGRVLEAGCGEGGDSVWLARQGWRVTAIDISQVAIDRAIAATKDDEALSSRITWMQGDLAEVAPDAGAYDLVTAHYFPLRRDPGDPGARNLLAAVAPGGTLLWAGHDMTDDPEHAERWAECYSPSDVADLLDDDWIVEANETRGRTRPAPEGSHHVKDVVLRARRR